MKTIQPNYPINPVMTHARNAQAARDEVRTSYYADSQASFVAEFYFSVFSKDTDLQDAIDAMAESMKARSV